MAKKIPAARPYVERLVTNLKTADGRPKTLDLGPKTLIVGPNGSGKSSIQQSLQLALIGSADDLLGRDAVKDNGLLMSMVSAERLSIHAKTSTEQDFVFIAKDGGRPAHDTAGDAVLPLHTVREVLEGSPATARKAFLAWAAAGVSTKDVEEMVPAVYAAKYRDISSAVGRGKNPVDALIATLEYVGKRQRDATKEASGAEALLKTMTLDLAEAPTEEALAEAKAQADDALRFFHSVQNAKGAQKRILGQIEQTRVALAQPTTPTVDATERQFYTSMATAAGIAAAQGLGACPLCASAVGVAHIKACAEFYAGEVASMVMPSAHTPSPEELKHRLHSLAHEIGQLPTTLLECDAVHANDAAAQAQTLYMEMRAAAEKWTSLRKARDTVSEMTRESETYKGMKKELEGVVSGLLGRVSDTFVKRVQAFMPTGWTFGLQLVDGEKEVFRLGLMDGKKCRAALSGAEWATVTCAIAMAVGSDAPADVPVLVMPEDRGWDADTLSKVLAAWSSFDGQVVIGTPTKPKKTPKGWTVIELGKVEAEPEAVVAEVVVVTKEEAKPSFSVFMPSPSMFAMLKALGYSNGQIAGLDKERAGHIIANGIIAGVEE